VYYCFLHRYIFASIEMPYTSAFLCHGICVGIKRIDVAHPECLYYTKTTELVQFPSMDKASGVRKKKHPQKNKAGSVRAGNCELSIQ